MSNPDTNELRKAIETGDWWKHCGVPISEIQKTQWIVELIQEMLKNPQDPNNDQSWIASGDSFIHVQRLEDGFVEIKDLRPVKTLLLEIPALKAVKPASDTEECTCDAAVLFAKGCQC